MTLSTDTNATRFFCPLHAAAHQFRGFIQKIAEEVDVELKGGDKILLSNGAELHFLGTSAATAQSYTGNLFLMNFSG